MFLNVPWMRRHAMRQDANSSVLQRQYESEIPEAKLVDDSRPAASHSQSSYFNSAHSDAAPPSYSTAMAQLQSDIHGGGQGQYVAQVCSRILFS